MRKLILLTSVIGMGIFASCSSKNNCVCTDSTGKEISNVDLSAATSSVRESTCNSSNTVYGLTGGKCELK